MFEKLSGLSEREQKQSAAGSVIAMTMVGKPVWTPRNYTALASEGFAKNAVAYRCVRMIAKAWARLEAASFLTDAERRHLAGLSEVEHCV